MAEDEDLEVLASAVLALLATADEETGKGSDDEVEERPHRPIVPGLSERESGFPTPTGARDFDKVIFELPIPAYEPSNALHQDLAATARVAEEVAASVTLPPAVHFVRTRSMVRGALLADGVGQKVEGLVVRLLGDAQPPD